MKIKKTKLTQLKISSPASYRINISGIVEETFLEYFSGMKINSVNDENNVTTLVGQVKDQAELLGVLNTLYDLHFAILYVKKIN